MNPNYFTEDDWKAELGLDEMTTRSKALHWWRNLNDTQRTQAVGWSKRNCMFAKEVEMLGADSLTGRMIEEVYNDFLTYWKL